MIILGVVFIFLLLISFGLIALAMRPTQQSSTVDKRIAALVAIRVRAGIGRKEEQNDVLGEEEDGAFIWLETLVEKTRVAEWLRTLLLQSASSWTLGGVIIAVFSLALIAFLATFFLTGMLPLSAVAACLAGYVPIAVLTINKRRRLARFDAALPSSIEMCARSLRAGHSMAVAISILAEEAAEPAKTEFREVFKRQSHGLPLRDALHQMLQRVPSRDLQVLVTGILVQKDTGGNLAEIMDRIVAVIRDRLRIQGDIRTQTAQGRLTGWILCLLPIALLLFINVVNPGYSSVLLHEPTGRKMLYGGLGLLAIGALMIRQIVNRIDI